MTDQHPDFSQRDTNAHVEALFLIIEADEGSISPRFEDHLEWAYAREDAREIMRYLAVYAAALGRRAYAPGPDGPGKTVKELLDEVAKIVSHSLPRPD